MLPGVVASHSQKRRRGTVVLAFCCFCRISVAEYLSAISHFAGVGGRPFAPGADPPINTFRPSRYSTKTPTHLLSPLLAWYAKTLISVPIGKLVFVMPFLKRLVGGPPSIPQLTTLPSGPFTSIHSQACGLINSTLVTVPCKLSGRFSSNAAANA